MRDTARIDWVLFDTTENSGIDTIIFEGGWVRFVPPPVKRISVELSSPQVRVRHDSTFTIPVRTSSLSGGNVNAGRLALGVDTNVFQVIGVLPALADSVRFDSISPGRFAVGFARKDTTSRFESSGTLFEVLLRAKLRIDTVCSSFKAPELESLNAGSLVDSVRYAFMEMCVEGFRPADTLSKVVREQVVSVCVMPNPAAKYCEFRVGEETRFQVKVYNALGAEVFQTDAIGDTRWTFNRSVTSGVYQAVITTQSSRAEANERRVISINVVH
jgi:hypothetical protein